MKHNRCPICGSPPTKVEEVEVPSNDTYRKFEKRFTCPNVDRADHRS